MRPLLLALAAVCLLLLPGLAFAQSATLSDGTVIFAGNIPEHAMPEIVKSLTPAQFAEYATLRNQQADRRADEYAGKYRESRGPLATTFLTDTTGTTRMTRAFAGPTATGRVGRGAAMYDTLAYTDIADRYVTAEREITYRDFNDGGGGPVLYINPYAWAYWRSHTIAD